MNISLKSLFIILLAAVFNVLPAADTDISISGQNEVRYARGEQPEGNSEEPFSYLENYLELNTNIDKFRLYLRQSLKLPSEFGATNYGINAIDKRYIEYRDKGMSIRGGDFYRTWGRGLFFGNVEFLELNLDTGLEGILIESTSDELDVAVFRGVETDTSGGFREAAEGAYVSYIFPKNIRLGGSISRLDEGARHPVINRTGYEFEGGLKNVNLYTAYVSDKMDSLNSDWTDYFHGFYSNATVYGMGWGLMFEYKNYELFTYNDPGIIGGVTDYPSLQYPATGVPLTTMYLMDRHPRLAHYYDDIGIQIEANASYQDYSFSLNYNHSSGHDGNVLLPQLKEKLSPYRAVFAHVEHERWGGNRIVLQAGWSENVEFTRTVNGGYSLWFKRLGLGSIYNYTLDDQHSMEFELQLMQETDNTPGRYDVHWEEFVAITFSRSPNLIVTGVIERTEDVKEVGAKNWKEGFFGGAGKYWPSVEVAVDFLERHQIRLFYGYERGGLRCTGGVCRLVNPFKGVKVIFTSNF